MSRVSDFRGRSLGDSWGAELPSASGVSTTLGGLIEQWAREVLWMRRDLDSQSADYFTSDDFEGALFARTRLAAGLEAVHVNEIPTILTVVDELFRSVTEELDEPSPANWGSDAAPSPQQWWWLRVPVRGPERKEIDRYRSSHLSQRDVQDRSSPSDTSRDVHPEVHP